VEPMPEVSYAVWTNFIFWIFVGVVLLRMCLDSDFPMLSSPSDDLATIRSIFHYGGQAFMG